MLYLDPRARKNNNILYLSHRKNNKMDLRMPRPNIEQQWSGVGEAAGGLAATEPRGVHGALRARAPHGGAGGRTDVTAYYI